MPWCFIDVASCPTVVDEVTRGLNDKNLAEVDVNRVLRIHEIIHCTTISVYLHLMTTTNVMICPAL